jgi:hypothetical protein
VLKWSGRRPPGLHLDLGDINRSATEALPLQGSVILCQNLQRAVFMIWQSQEHESILSKKKEHESMFDINQ